MFDMSSSELLLILAVALVVTKPKDIPVIATKIGKIIRKCRMEARQFMAAIEEQADLKDVKDAIKDINDNGLKMTTVTDAEGNTYPAYDMDALEADLGKDIRKPRPKTKKKPARHKKKA